jgi:hypothetical protein
MSIAYPLTAASLALFTICSQPAAADVYRCEQEGEPVLYSQFVCPPQRQQETYQPRPHNLVSMPPLSTEESTALASLEKNLQRTRLAASQTRARARKEQARRVNRAEQLCDNAKYQLAALRERKRQGYSAASARKLAADAERLQIQKKANC